MAEHTIMVVEDDSTSAEVLLEMLRRLGYALAPTAATGPDAVRAALESRPDLILMDIILAGEMDGIAAAAAIHERMDVPVIYLTAFSDETVLRRAKATEPYSYLVKPVRNRELEIAIELALHRHQMAREMARHSRYLEELVARRTAVLEAEIVERRRTQALLEQEAEFRRAEERERERLREQLLQAQKMEAIGTLAGGIAHDFNNILGAIIGYGEMMQMFEIPADSPLHASLEPMLTSAYRARDLVDRILTFSRRSDVEKQLLPAHSLIRESTAFLRASLPATIEIRTEMEEISGAVLANPLQIQQVVMNLCTNAAHAMADQGGVLRIGLEAIRLGPEETGRFPGVAPGRYAMLSVADTGTGIPPECADRVFDPYFTTRETGKGTGLGLAIAQGIIQQHAGAIMFETAPRRGTTFRVVLPLVDASADSESPEPELTLRPGKGRILLVDDEPSLTALWERVLRELGFQVRAETDSRETLKRFAAAPGQYDLVITDQTMAHLTGLELAGRIRAIRPDIPVILCTGFSEAVTVERIREAGIDLLVRKPVGIRHLIDAVHRLLEQRRPRSPGGDPVSAVEADGQG